MAEVKSLDSSNNPEEYTYPIYENGRFRNPWNTWEGPSMKKFFEVVMHTKSDVILPEKAALDNALPVLKPDLSQFEMSPASGIRHLWIGHSTSLVQFDGVTFLTDPIFSNRCSPIQQFGIKRYRPPACTIQDLPNIDCVIISHNHYDHLDYGSVVALNQRFGDNLRWYVPMGLKKWMNDNGCRNVVELSWWQENVYRRYSEESQVKFISTPCQHWSKRTLIDDNEVLWTSWVVKGPKHSFYFAGDTGYCAGFKQIGRRYGPFTLSTIPIGAYHPRAYFGTQHIDPAQAVDVHLDIKSQKSIGIHWGTFVLTKEFYLEPRHLVKEELEKRGMDALSFVTVSHGEITLVGRE